MHRNTPHSSTGKTPSEIMMNHVARGKIPTIVIPSIFDERIIQVDRATKASGKRHGDARQRARPLSLKVRDKVLVKRIKKRSKLSSNFARQPFTILKRRGSEAILESMDGTQYRRNVAHLKKYSGLHPTTYLTDYAI